MRSRRAAVASLPASGGELTNRMREIFKSGSVGGVGGDPGSYPEPEWPGPGLDGKGGLNG